MKLKFYLSPISTISNPGDICPGYSCSSCITTEIIEWILVKSSMTNANFFFDFFFGKIDQKQTLKGTFVMQRLSW